VIEPDWGFRPVIGLSDLPDPGASVAELDQFANTLSGYQGWGNDSSVAAVSDWVMDHLKGAQACSSVLKLRTALFWHARKARFTDEVSPSLMPREAMFESELRAILRTLRSCMTAGPRDDNLLADVVDAVAKDIPKSQAFVEHHLRDAIVNRLAASANAVVGSPVIAAAELSLGKLPGWAPDDPPGKFDVAVMHEAPSQPRVLAEVKWSDRNTLSHSLWDAAKLIGGLAKSADHVYLIGGWPAAIWKRAPSAALYQQGEVDFASLAALPGEWPWLDRHSQGRALVLPNRLRVTNIATISVPHRDSMWELRAVSLEPAAGDWIWLNNGLIEGAIPLHEHDAMAAGLG
jgi:hypothetical protein